MAKETGMRLFWLTALAMAAFAANSVLNRMAVAQYGMDPLDFAVLRLVSGALMLACLVAARGSLAWPGWAGRGAGVFGLLLYLFGFSLAYVDLAAGVGALVLFGMVQVTMFGGAVLSGEHVPVPRWLGAGLAFGGLVWLVSPAGQAVALLPALMMAAAGIGWGIYSLAGRGARDPLAATAANFCLAVPVMLVVALWQLDVAALTWARVGLAALSGAVMSGLGYALWYAVVPQLGASRAGVAQLSVPVLAAVAGALLLDESLTWRFGVAALVVLGGVGLGSLSGRRS
jgi:drug/metabolite transporter (DMT)-like permease